MNWVMITKKDGTGTELATFKQDEHDKLVAYVCIDYDYMSLEESTIYGVKNGVISVINPDENGVVSWKDYDIAITVHKI